MIKFLENAAKTAGHFINFISPLNINTFFSTVKDRNLNLNSEILNLGDEIISSYEKYKQAGKLLKGDERYGFRFGMGVMTISNQTVESIQNFRNILTNNDQRIGFDLALSSRIGSLK